VTFPLANMSLHLTKPFVTPRAGHGARQAVFAGEANVRSIKEKKMKKCRECQHDVSDHAKACPNCGAPYPTKEKWEDWGFEYKSKTTIMSIPLLHISFKYRPNGRPVPAKGIISIGQFGIGIINVSQFGIGVISIGQFTIAVYALAQLAIAYSLIAQIGLYVKTGYGQLVWNIVELIKNF